MRKNKFPILCLAVACICNIIRILRSFDPFTLATLCVTALAVILLLMEDKHNDR